MISCKRCGTSNLTDSKFCRECGTALTETLILDDAVDTLVADGQRLFGEDRASEARMLAEAALRHDENSVAALALMGDCLERQGRLEEALECYERVVEIQPESALDHIRVAQLRRQVAGRGKTTRPEVSGRRMAAVASVAAGLLIFASATAIVVATRGADVPASAVAQREPEPVSAPFQGTHIPTPRGQTQAPKEEQPEAANEGAARPQEQQTNRSGAARVPISGTLPFGPDGSAALKPEATSQLPQQVIIQADPPAGTTQTMNAGSTAANGSIRVPDPTPIEEDEDQGPPPIVDIRPSKSNPTQVGGSQSIPDREERSNEAEALTRVARDHYTLGNYAKAADAYEKALRVGADSGSTNQRLGQCYEKLGRKSEAIAAYQRALRSYESQVAGSSDSGRIQSAIAACKQALRLLQGG